MAQKKPKTIKLTEEQEREGYRIEQTTDGVQVWHDNHQLAFLLLSTDIQKKVQDIVKKNLNFVKERREDMGYELGYEE